MAAEAYPTPLAGQRLTATLLRSMQPQTLRKPGDTARSATTTQAADPHLQMDVVANGVYTISGWVIYDAATAGDFVLGWSFPSGTGTWVGHGGGTTVTSATGAGGTQQDASSTWGYNVRMEATALNATRTYGGLGAGTQLTVLLSGTYRAGSTGGTLALTWAQSVSTATATTVYTDSWLSVQRTA
ncbi:hypothetical protein [Streptomyces capoamus]|uniref:hypothetical protein n=1 Tax=Streptomyces capoamus TaxID=68183 RepID=UPI003398EB56